MSSMESVVPQHVMDLFASLNIERQNDSLLHIADHHWERLLRFADLAHVTLPLARRVDVKLPSWVRERLDINLRDNELRFGQVKNTFVEADKCLREAEVEYVVIKGFTLAPDYVEAPWLRQQSDLDLYCGPDGIEAAQEALVAIGYEPEKYLDYSEADHSPTLLRLGDWRWRGNAFDPGMPLSVELHFCLWNEKVTLLEDQEIRHFFSRRAHRRIAGMDVPSLSNVDTLGHLSMHILRNLLLHGKVIHHLYELSRFLHNKTRDEGYWNLWMTQHSEDLRLKEALSFELARQCFGCDLSETAKEQIRRLPKEQKAWLMQCGRMPMTCMFQESRDAVWLHWSLLNDWKKKKVLLRRHFLPTRPADPDVAVNALNGRDVANLQGTRWGRIAVHYSRRVVAYLSLRCRTLYRWFAWRLRILGGSSLIVE